MGANTHREYLNNAGAYPKILTRITATATTARGKIWYGRRRFRVVSARISSTVASSAGVLTLLKVAADAAIDGSPIITSSASYDLQQAAHVVRSIGLLATSANMFPIGYSLGVWVDTNPTGLEGCMLEVEIEEFED